MRVRGRGEDTLVLTAVQKLDTFNRRVGGDVEEERVPQGWHLCADNFELLAVREREGERVNESGALGEGLALLLELLLQRGKHPS